MLSSKNRFIICSPSFPLHPHRDRDPPPRPSLEHSFLPVPEATLTLPGLQARADPGGQHFSSVLVNTPGKPRRISLPVLMSCLSDPLQPQSLSLLSLILLWAISKPAHLSFPQSQGSLLCLGPPFFSFCDGFL